VIIDAHHHLWDPGTRQHAWLDGVPALRRRFDLADFRRAAAPQGVSAGVLVQVLANTAETEEFLALAARAADERPGSARNGSARNSSAGPSSAGPGSAGPGSAGPGSAGPGSAGARSADAGAGVSVAGVVGWVDLCARDVGGEIARLRGLPGGDRLAGIRHLVQDEPDLAWLDRAEVRRGLRAVGQAGLAYDLLIRPRQLPAALRVTGDLDDLRFVLDHAAKPPIATGTLEPWATLLTELGTRPNVSCKLSGLVTEAAAGWRPAQFARYADVILDSFGPDRLMFGSDWPVCTVAATYGEVFALARDLASRQLSPAERAAVFAGTARSAYRLEPLQDGGQPPWAAGRDQSGTGNR
jgi:L-fuconolactonase